MKWIIVVLSIVLVMPIVSAQKYYSRTARVFFISEAPLEKIEGINNSGYIIIDAVSGAIEMSVLIKGFTFEKALMQDHFNENYMESTKFPKGIFKGSVSNLSEVNFAMDGDYTVKATGTMTLHGVSKPLTTTAGVNVKGGILSAHSTFEIVIADYNIDVPKVVRENIAKSVRVSVQTDLKKM